MLGLSKLDKRIKETTVEFIVHRLVNDSDNEEEVSSGPVHRALAKPAKNLSTASRTPVTSWTYILTSGIKKGKQCKLKV